MPHGNILKTLRQRAHLTQEQVAELLNVAPTTVQNWERTQRFSTPEMLHDLLDLYQVDDTTRQLIVLLTYGDTKSAPASNNIDCMTSLQLGIASSNSPAELRTHALLLLQARIQCLHCTIAYIREKLDRKSTLLSSRATAENIDRLGKEYGIFLDAERSYDIFLLNTDLQKYFPLGDFFQPIYIVEYHCMMTMDDFISKRMESIPPHKKVNQELLKSALEDITEEYQHLLFLTDCINTEGNVAYPVIWDATPIQCNVTYVTKHTIDTLSQFLRTHEII